MTDFLDSPQPNLCKQTLTRYKAKRQQEEEAQVMQGWEDGYVSSNVLPRYKAYIAEAIARSLPMTFKDCWKCACSTFRRNERDYNLATTPAGGTCYPDINC